jgi:hypothetical protein
MHDPKQNRWLLITMLKWLQGGSFKAMDIYTEILTSDIFLKKAIYEAHEGRCFYTGRFVNLHDVW